MYGHIQLKASEKHARTCWSKMKEPEPPGCPKASRAVETICSCVTFITVSPSGPRSLVILAWARELQSLEVNPVERPDFQTRFTDFGSSSRGWLNLIPGISSSDLAYEGFQMSNDPVLPKERKNVPCKPRR